MWAEDQACMQLLVHVFHSKCSTATDDGCQLGLYAHSCACTKAPHKPCALAAVLLARARTLKSIFPSA